MYYNYIGMLRTQRKSIHYRWSFTFLFGMVRCIQVSALLERCMGCIIRVSLLANTWLRAVYKPHFAFFVFGLCIILNPVYILERCTLFPVYVYNVYLRLRGYVVNAVC